MESDAAFTPAPGVTATDHELSPIPSVVVTRSPVFPPVGGVALRVAANVEALSRLGDVTVLTIGTPAAPHGVGRGVTVHGFERVRTTNRGDRARERLGQLHPRRHPVVSGLRASDAMAALCSTVKTSGPRGIVVLEEVWTAGYLDVSRDAGWAVVYDAHNVESMLRREMAQQTWAERSQKVRQHWMARQLSAVESRLVRNVDQVWACGEPDRELLARMRGSDAEVLVVPNTVRAAEDATATKSVRPTVMVAEHAIVYPAMFGYPPNEEAALVLIKEVMPRLRATDLDVQLLLVGRHPTSAMRVAAQGHEDVLITGEVDDMRPYLEHADVVGVPLLNGGGTRLKILEAFAAGAPVVSTSKGAEGLDVIDGRHALVRDDMTSFAAAVRHVLVDQDLRDRLRTQGRRLVEERYSWGAAAHLVEQHVRTLGLA